MLIIADVVKIVSEVLYIAMIDSFKRQFYPRMRQAGQERKISDSHRKGYSLTFQRLFFILTFASGKYQNKDKPTKTSEKTRNRRGRVNMIDPVSGQCVQGS